MQQASFGQRVRARREAVTQQRLADQAAHVRPGSRNAIARQRAATYAAKRAAQIARASERRSS